MFSRPVPRRLLAVSLPGLAFAQTAAGKLKIGVIGAGNIGSTIGGLWIKAGHQVLFSSRHPEELKPLVERSARWPRPARSAKRSISADVILVAVPYKAIPELAKEYGPKFAGKIVIDPANAVARRDGEELLNETKEKGIGYTTAVLSQGLARGACVQLDELHQLRQGGASRRRADGDPDGGR